MGGASVLRAGGASVLRATGAAATGAVTSMRENSFIGGVVTGGVAVGGVVTADGAVLMRGACDGFGLLT